MWMWSRKDRRKAPEPSQLPSAMRFSKDRSSYPWAYLNQARSKNKFARRANVTIGVLNSTSYSSWASTRRKGKLLRSIASSTAKLRRESKPISRRTHKKESLWWRPTKRSCGLLRPLSTFSWEGTSKKLSIFVMTVESTRATMWVGWKLQRRKRLKW